MLSNFFQNKVICFTQEEGSDGSTQDDEYYEQQEVDNEENIKSKSCDVCDRDFYTTQQYQKHMSEHRTCGLDGCTFTAHEKVVEKHIFMQHSTGLYDKIKTLSTPEDIAKWREERKKRYPTKENIEIRYKRQAEMLKRGERIGPNKARFARKDNSRFASKRNCKKQANRKKKPAAATKTGEPNKTVSLLDDRSDWNGDLNPFRGTSELYNVEEESEHVTEFDDSEWAVDNISNGPVKLNNALGALMGAYNTSDESDLDELVPDDMKISTKPTNNSDTRTKTEEIKIVDGVKIEDDDAPLEMKTSKTPLPENVASSSGCASETKAIIADSDGKSRKRKRFVKGKPNRSHKNVKDGSGGFSRHNFVKRRATLLEKLLDGEIRHERNVLLQCVRFVVSNNFFQKTD